MSCIRSRILHKVVDKAYEGPTGMHIEYRYVYGQIDRKKEINEERKIDR